MGVTEFSGITKKIPGNVKVYILLTLILIVTILYFNWRVDSLKSKLAQSEGNVAALKDTVRVVKTKNGELEAVKLVLLADKNKLKDLSDSLYKEVIKEKGKVKVIAGTDVEIKTTDTIRIKNTVLDSASIAWSYDNDGPGGSRHLAGICNRDTTKITRDELKLHLVTGLKENGDKQLEIFIRTAYPGVTFSRIEGAVLDPSMFPKAANKHFSVGPCISAIVDYTGSIRLGVGVSVQWALFKF